ncbi:hypothetical protein EG329_012284 [Mollisiaceae sp. DMI_Dod_QoI]|nr:hypothetical protein EG329_012284 [Helotiales sp. DMI_Dod_QoI]
MPLSFSYSGTSQNATSGRPHSSIQGEQANQREEVQDPRAERQIQSDRRIEALDAEERALRAQLRDESIRYIERLAEARATRSMITRLEAEGVWQAMSAIILARYRQVTATEHQYLLEEARRPREEFAVQPPTQRRSRSPPAEQSRTSSTYTIASRERREDLAFRLRMSQRRRVARHRQELELSRSRQQGERARSGQDL